MRAASTKREDGFFGVVCWVRYACLVLDLVDTGTGGGGRRAGGNGPSASTRTAPYSAGRAGLRARFCGMAWWNGIKKVPIRSSSAVFAGRTRCCGLRTIQTWFISL
jgi:hypothetical protein